MTCVYLVQQEPRFSEEGVSIVRGVYRTLDQAKHAIPDMDIPREDTVLIAQCVLDRNDLPSVAYVSEGKP